MSTASSYDVSDIEVSIDVSVDDGGIDVVSVHSPKSASAFSEASPPLTPASASSGPPVPEATDSQDSDMTEEEVNQMVQDALRRARRAMGARAPSPSSQVSATNYDDTPEQTAVVLVDEASKLGSTVSKDLKDPATRPADAMDGGEEKKESVATETGTSVGVVNGYARGAGVAMSETNALEDDDRILEETFEEESQHSQTSKGFSKGAVDSSPHRNAQLEVTFEEDAENDQAGVDPPAGPDDSGFEDTFADARDVINDEFSGQKSNAGERHANEGELTRGGSAESVVTAEESHGEGGDDDASEYTEVTVSDDGGREKGVRRDSPEGRIVDMDDDSSEYTEETVSDASSEYTEETVSENDDTGTYEPEFFHEKSVLPPTKEEVGTVSATSDRYSIGRNEFDTEAKKRQDHDNNAKSAGSDIKGNTRSEKESGKSFAARDLNGKEPQTSKSVAAERKVEGGEVGETTTSKADRPRSGGRFWWNDESVTNDAEETAQSEKGSTKSEGDARNEASSGLDEKKAADKIVATRSAAKPVGSHWWNNEDTNETKDEKKDEPNIKDKEETATAPAKEKSKKLPSPVVGKHWWNETNEDVGGKLTKEKNLTEEKVGTKTESTKDAKVDISSQSEKGRFPLVQVKSSASENTSQYSSPKRRRPIEFRHPYPVPPAQARPRSPAEIIRDNSTVAKDRFIRWIQPTPQLEELLAAAKGTSLARRSNACGAIKVLAAKKKNQLTLARTLGLLDALIFAANEKPTSEDADAALDARTRAVTAILFLAEPKENRVLVFEHPNLPQCLVKVIKEDCGEARVHATSALAVMAKTAQNRDEMVKIKHLLTTLAKVVGGKCDNISVNAVDIIPEMESDDSSDEDSVTDDDDDEEDDTYVDDSTLPEEEDTDGSTLGDDGSTLPYDKSMSQSFEESPVNSPNSKSTIESPDKDSRSLGGGSLKENNPGDSNLLLPKRNSKSPKKRSPSLRRIQHEKYEEFLGLSRLNSCAALTHFSKHCAVSPTLCQNEPLLENLVLVAREFDNPIHTRCIEILCHLTRFPANNARLARRSELVDGLIKCGKSKIAEDRMWAARSLQNLTAEASSKIVLATGPLLNLLSVSAMRKDYDEQLAAVGALLNLSTEPGAIVPVTNTKNVVATLVHLAHSSDSSSEVRRMACDALATIGLWLQTLAGAGSVPDDVTPIPLPSHAASGWLRWE